MTNIKVWGRRNSVNVQKVMWAIGEMNLEFRRYDIGGSFGINDNYLKLNPSGTVPTIEDGDFILWESNACVRYLAREYGMGDLYPEDSQKIGLAEQWMDFQASSLYPMFMLMFLNGVNEFIMHGYKFNGTTFKSNSVFTYPKYFCLCIIKN